MSKSPHRLRGDAAECWRAILFGEIVRAINLPVTVRVDPTIKLPRSGRWEGGLGRVTPALDDALGAAAFAVAWRWACAEQQANAWPGLSLIARQAVDFPVSVGEGTALAWTGAANVFAGPASPGGRTWRLMLPGGTSEIGVSAAEAARWADVDRIADVAAAWLDAQWCVA